VSVDDHGHAQQIEMLWAAPSVADWCRTFFSQLRFQPASSGDVAEPGTALILLRVLDYRRPDLTGAPFRFRDSRHVQDYVATLRGVEVPSVTELLFATAGGEAGLFVYASVGSEWSSNISISRPIPKHVSAAIGSGEAGHNEGRAL